MLDLGKSHDCETMGTYVCCADNFQYVVLWASVWQPHNNFDKCTPSASAWQWGGRPVGFGQAPASGLNAVKVLDGAEIDFKQEVQDFEITLLKQALERAQFNQKKAAELLSVSYHQLRGYLRKYDLLG